MRVLVAQDKGQKIEPAERIHLGQAADYALAHVFVRQSVAPEHQLGACPHSIPPPDPSGERAGTAERGPRGRWAVAFGDRVAPTRRASAYRRWQWLLGCGG